MEFNTGYHPEQKQFRKDLSQIGHTRIQTQDLPISGPQYELLGKGCYFLNGNITF